MIAGAFDTARMKLRKAPRKLQAAAAAGMKERDFMPEASDLPEFMQEAEFRKRFGVWAHRPAAG
jgi:hypothetical protein